MEKALRILMIISLFFAAVVGFLMVTNWLMLKQVPVIDNPALEALQDDGVSPEETEQYRNMQLMVRRVFFFRTRQLEWGRWFLIISVGLFLFAWQIRDLRGANPPGKPKKERKAPPVPLPFLILGAVIAVSGILTSFLTERDFNRRAGISAGGTAADASGSAETEIAIDDDVCPCIAIQELSDSYIPVQEDSQGNWTAFRGADGTGRLDDARPPLRWDGPSGEGILWTTELELEGFSSPVLWNDHLYLSGSDGTTAGIICLDRNTGELLWQYTESTADGTLSPFPEVSPDTGWSAPTPACDVNGVYAEFANGDLMAVSHRGEILWKDSAGTVDIPFGFASSLICYRGTLVVQKDLDEGCVLSLYDTATGERRDIAREETGPSWMSPMLADNGDQTILILGGREGISAVNPADGTVFWRQAVLSGDTAPSPAFDGDRIFAVSPDLVIHSVDLMKGLLMWEADYAAGDVSSPVASEELLFMALSWGLLVCYDSETGDFLWEYEAEQGWYASPLILGDRLFCFDRDGKTAIFPLEKNQPEPLENDLGVPLNSTPAYADGVLYFRSGRTILAVGGV